MEEYKGIVNGICKKIHTGLIDFDAPRREASMPTQASSEFITNKHSDAIVAVRYGKSDDLVAGDSGFEQFFKDYQNP